MKKQQLPLILFGLIAAMLLAYFILNSDNNKRFSWNETYKVSSDQPYGTLFIKRLLETYKESGTFTLNDTKPVKALFRSNSIKNKTDYYFIGQSIYLDKEDRYQLMKFVEKGNDAFISSLDPPTDLIDDMHIAICEGQLTYDPFHGKMASMNFFNDSIRTASGFDYTYRFGPRDKAYNWTYITDEVFCQEGIITPLGFHSEDKINFVKVGFGKGNFFFHANPVVFTNYFISQERHLMYPALVFSHTRGNHILWDEYSKMPFSMNSTTSQGPLYYILQQPSLKHAWWLLLLTISLYVLFTAKRTQRVIPVLEAKSNTSLEFIKLISALHFQNGNHLDMAKKKMKYFLYFIRSRYGIHTQAFTPQITGKLAQKSNVPVETIQTILKLHNSIEHSTTYRIDVFMLMNFYQAIENFYKHCK